MPALSSWNDYFIVVGGGSAALTGLVFVAMTLHLDEIATNPVHRHRARTILTGLTAVFIRSALVLMGGQNAQAVAVELIVVLVIVEAILFRSIRQAASSADSGVLMRTIGSFACLLLEQAGAVVLFFRQHVGPICGRVGNDVVVHLHGERCLAALGRCRSARGGPRYLASCRLAGAGR